MNDIEQIFRDEVLDNVTVLEQELLRLERGEEQKDALNSIFRCLHTIKGSAGLVGQGELENLAHEIESSFERLRSAEHPVTVELAELGLRACDRIRDLVIAPGSLDPSGTAALIEAFRVLEEGRDGEDGPLTPREHKPPFEEQGSAEPSSKQALDVLRVASAKLDNLVDLIGELVTVQARLAQTSGRYNDPDLAAISEEVDRLSWELRDQVLTIRMLPIGSTFDGFRRLVRDLAVELGKRVELVTEGGKTEVDKTVIERIHDPLVHLVRNCIDHGMESPEERLEAGKAAHGTLTLSAEQSGGRVIIQIEDDGAGIDYQAVERRARSLGLIDDGTDLDPKERSSLIFLPGLSTATRVSTLSGRGVGLDIVKQSIEDLRGTLAVSSSPGRGTRFTISLPLTLAIIEGLLVRIGSDHYVFPLAAIEECIELHRREVTTTHSDLIEIRGEAVPFLRLRDEFGLEGTPPAIEHVVIARLNEERIGFTVDEVVGGHQTVIKSLGRTCRDLRGISGATILGDGTVALIIDVQQMVERALSLRAA